MRSSFVKLPDAVFRLLCAHMCTHMHVCACACVVPRGSEPLGTSVSFSRTGNTVFGRQMLAWPQGSPGDPCDLSPTVTSFSRLPPVPFLITIQTLEESRKRPWPSVRVSQQTGTHVCSCLVFVTRGPVPSLGQPWLHTVDW